MPSDTQVVADGLEERVESKPSFSPATLLALALFLGVAIVLVFTGDPVEEVATQPADDATRAVPDATPGDTDIAMSDAVRGFPDALVTVAATEAGTFEFLIWPRDGSLAKRTMTGGDTATFDSASQILAVTTENSTLPGFGLAVGRHTQLRPAVPMVSSFSWHDTDSGHLAFTTEQADGEWRLWHLRPNLTADVIATDSLMTGDVVAWGDWGWAIQTEDGTIRLLTPEAEFKAERPGAALASRRDGWLFVIGDGPELVSAGGGVKILDIDLETLGEVRFAEFSRDGSRIALSGTEGTAVWEIDQGLVAEFPFRVAGAMKFSSDGRYVVAPGPVGVMVFDLEQGTRSVLLEQYRALATSVVPIRGS